MSDPELDLASTPLGDFLTRLAARDPTPGGGTAMAVAGAAGAALVRMVALASVGREEFAAQEALLQAIADQARETRLHLLSLAEKDAKAYGAVVAAYALPNETEAEQEARRSAVHEALKGAIEVPLRIMESCVEVIGIARNAVEAGNKNAASDGAAGAELGRAGLRGAAGIVRANLKALANETYAKDVRTRLDEMLYMGTKTCTALDSYVQDLWT
jgi:formiminotetrahydrofolate cyclodeaminase